MISVSAFEMGNLAATLLILRVTQVLTPAHGLTRATEIGLLLYLAYNIFATLFSVPAGHVSDRVGPVRVFGAGAVSFVLSYVLFAISGPSILFLGLAFVLAGLGIACAETAQSAAVAALAPANLRGSAFGVLASVQSFGNLAASAVAGFIWTLVSPEAAFVYLAVWMALAVVGIAMKGQTASRPRDLPRGDNRWLQFGSRTSSRGPSPRHLIPRSQSP